MRRFLLSVAALLLALFWGQAQTVRSIAVSDGESYTDHISLAEDSRDMDVMVKFIFDEKKNTLTVSVLSYRSLFVFREAVPYRGVVRCHRLHPDRLPYVAQAEEGSSFTLSKELRKSLPRPHRKYVFNRWVECDGLQSIPMEYKMVNDYIEQTFDILSKRTTVSVTLRDLYILECKNKKSGSYEILKGKDLDTQYLIRIVRNPCLDLDKEIAAARQMADEAKQAFEGLRASYPGGTVPSQEALNLLIKTRQVLQTQFPPRKGGALCSDLRDATDRYNGYADSIATFTCKVVSPDEGVIAEARPLDVKMVYSQARQLDKSVARWLVSKDELERHDLVTQCEEIIEDMAPVLKRATVTTAEEKKALTVYRQAEEYFRKTCKK